jgi:hypothetical protein
MSALDDPGCAADRDWFQDRPKRRYRWRPAGDGDAVIVRRQD